MQGIAQCLASPFLPGERPSPSTQSQTEQRAVITDAASAAEAHRLCRWLERPFRRRQTVASDTLHLVHLISFEADDILRITLLLVFITLLIYLILQLTTRSPS